MPVIRPVSLHSSLFFSAPVFDLFWHKEEQGVFEEIGEKLKVASLRVRISLKR